MKLHYFKDAKGNFGDDLNVWLWPQLLPGIFDDNSDSRVFVGIGTLLNQYVPSIEDKVVFGTEVGYGNAPIVDKSYDIRFVRSPVSAKALGIPVGKSLVDSAYGIALLRQDLNRGDAVGFMPHCRTADDPRWKSASEDCGLELITPRAHVEEVIRSIAKCRLLVTEALHGAIVADALRVPWIPIRLHDYILDLKWNDWCASIGIAYEPLTFGVPKRLEFESRRISRRDLSVNVMMRALSIARHFRRQFLSSGPTHERLPSRLAAHVDLLCS